MGKRVNRQWEGIQTGPLTVNRLNLTSSQVLVTAPAGSINQGVVRLSRLIGCSNVRVRNWVVGDGEIHVWHGVILTDLDKNDTTNPVPVGSLDENDGSWLWREPLPVFDHNTVVSVNEWFTSVRFDWPIRGGRGSSLGPEAAMSYVVGINPFVQAAPFEVQVFTVSLLLFSST